MSSWVPALRRPDPRMRTAVRAVALSGASLALATMVFSGPSAALSAGVGAAIASSNLWLLARIVTALLPEDQAPAPANASATESATETVRGEAARHGGTAWTLVVLLKMLGLFSLVWLFMRHGAVSPVPMLVGFGALPIGIAIGSIVSDRSADSLDRLHR